MVARVGAVPGSPTDDLAADVSRAINPLSTPAIACLALMNGTTRKSWRARARGSGRALRPRPREMPSSMATTAFTRLAVESVATSVWDIATFRVRDAKPQKVRLCCPSRSGGPTSRWMPFGAQRTPSADCLGLESVHLNCDQNDNHKDRKANDAGAIYFHLARSLAQVGGASDISSAGTSSRRAAQSSLARRQAQTETLA
jgi:hypothetical protein